MPQYPAPNTQRLLSWRQIGPGIAVARPIEELRAAFARAGLIAIDLDECIYPGISQEAMAARLAARLLRRHGARRHIPRMLLGGAWRAWTRLKGLAGLPTPVPRLVEWFEWALRGIAEEDFHRAASRLPKHSFPLAAETIALLAQHAPTGIVTLGLDVVARAYAAQFAGISFFEANTLLFAPGPRGQPVFTGYDRNAALFNGDDKARALERRLAQQGREPPAGSQPAGDCVPIVIGHNDDDVAMARLARGRGGLAIGFNPPRRLWDEFAAIATGPDWESVYALVAILSGPTSSRRGGSPGID